MDRPVSIVKLQDCMEGMKEFTDKHFDICIADPPYGIDVARMAYTQEDNRPCKQKNGSTLRVKKKKYKHGSWDKATPADEYFQEIFRVSKHQIIWGIDYFTIDGIGGGRIRWDKLVPEGMSFNRYEKAYCSFIENEVEFQYLWAGMCQAKSLKESTMQQGNKSLNEERIHPTHKPINLYKWLLIHYAKEGDKILDPYLGSGSSRIACWDGGFDFWGFELDPDYHAASEKRFQNHILQQKLF